MTDKEIKLLVTVFVEDHGELDEQTLRKGVVSGIEIMQEEGALTAPDDESTVINGWSVTHGSTDQPAELQNALALCVKAIDSLLPHIGRIPADIGLINDALCAARPLLVRPEEAL